MPTIIDTADRAAFSSFSANDIYYIYNGLDCCLTSEIFEAIVPKLDSDTAYVYAFERELQGPLMEMSGRGVLIDKAQRNRMVKDLQSRADRLQSIIQRFAHAVWDKPLNPASPTQLKSFFYEHMGIKPIRVQVGGGRWEISTNREALEKIQLYFHARPIATTLLALRDVTKKIQTLTTGIDPDGRFRTSFNIAATVTGRLSSSENCFGTGGNLQNITGDLRSCFIADPGKKLGYFDLAQAESRGVGLLAYLVTGRATYLDACEAGDLHTTVAKLCWPRLPWTGELKHDRALAEERFYRMFSRRDLAKRGGHGSNYFGQPPTIARNLQIDISVAKEFQDAYFKAFPEIPEWHKWVENEILSRGALLTPLRRFRQFFGRSTDGSTLRAAIAHTPQSMIADMVDRAIINIWRDLPQVELLMQVHDAIVVQYPAELEEELVPKIQSYMRQEMEFDDFEVFCPWERRKKVAKGRKFSIGSDAQVGWNWAKAVSPEYAAKKKMAENPYGLEDWKGRDTRKPPVPVSALMSALNRPMSSLRA